MYSVRRNLSRYITLQFRVTFQGLWASGWIGGKENPSVDGTMLLGPETRGSPQGSTVPPPRGRLGLQTADHFGKVELHQITNQERSALKDDEQLPPTAELLRVNLN